ncbi:Phosphoserine phosphatase [Corynebacterium camporealensis]|uniref:phosphoserine phosphatase n=1 Tax=Corynebacterium camporealensis TaxID=161896 RepID=A0A0F6TBD1_9CORY|nr:phosphoserine phosphatase SerB [Corynebacterium camporealensis]AKE39794.1 phosphoserine phosphatase SerB [Corynebacterium camporealensis]AVH88915.1 Phosphoserine phosphatase [Corynebacterium camporealensis]
MTRVNTPTVITTSGPDKPGVSAAFFRVLAAHDVELIDVEQALFSGRISLSAYTQVDPDKLEAIEKGLRDTLSIYQQHVSITPDSQEHSRPRSTHVVVLLGESLAAGDVSAVAQTLANHDANIDRIRGLSTSPMTGLELYITLNDAPERLRADLADLSHQRSMDIAIEQAGLHRRSKRLVCFDCDSTLITGEVIEMLAAHADREAEVAAVTERAMRGEIDFEESLRERVKALAGLPESVIESTARDLQLTPGVRRTIETLKRMGFRVAVVSGGFIQVLEDLADDLDLDYVRANTLEVKDGQLTGNVIGQVVDREAKANFLRSFAADSGVSMAQTVAIGDGANDIDMISAAGLGIAFNAKPALREVADGAVNHPQMDSVLHLLGIPADEVADE